MGDHDFTALPEELTALPQWVTWRTEEREGKPTKVPYRADGQGRASTTNPDTWAPYDEAVLAMAHHGHDGVTPSKVARSTGTTNVAKKRRRDTIEFSSSERSGCLNPILRQRGRY